MYQLHLLFDCCIIYCMSYRGLTVHFFGADSWVPTEKVDSWALEPNCSGNQRPTARGTNLQLSGGPTVRPEKTESFHLKPLYWATRGAKIDKFCNNDRMKHSNVVFIVCSHKLSCLVGSMTKPPFLVANNNCQYWFTTTPPRGWQNWWGTSSSMNHAVFMDFACSSVIPHPISSNPYNFRDSLWDTLNAMVQDWLFLVKSWSNDSFILVYFHWEWWCLTIYSIDTQWQPFQIFTQPMPQWLQSNATQAT